jgi:hypothetical protein
LNLMDEMSLLQEKREELEGLCQHLLELEGEKEEVLRSKRSYEAEKKRAMGEIHKLRTKVAAINSQMSQVKGLSTEGRKGLRVSAPTKQGRNIP